MSNKVLVALVLVLLLVSSLSACSSGVTTPTLTAALGQQFTLPVGQTAEIKGENLSVHFVKVSADSRCPTGVQCIRAGDATCAVQFTLSGATTDVNLVDIGGTGGFTQSKFSVYTLNFRVDPYPASGKTIAAADYRLVMTISK